MNSPILVTLSIFPNLDYIDCKLEITQNGNLIQKKAEKIPAPPWENYQKWQNVYSSLQTNFRREPARNFRLEAESAQTTQCGDTEIQECNSAFKKLELSLIEWFEHRSWIEICTIILDQTTPESTLFVVFETEDEKLKKIPWSIWKLFDKRRKAAWSISSLDYSQSNSTLVKANKVKILAILGDSENIDVEHDRQSLNNIPNAEVKFLVEPKHQVISEDLFSQPWHIIFFAGHSTSNKRGILKINREQSITITDLKHGLQQAIDKGLQLAIFNSCDGLQLAEDLAELNIPLVIVMREAVRDDVAQNFLMKFLDNYAVKQESLYESVRKSQVSLIAQYEPSELEKNWGEKIPGVSWLPVLCHNNHRLVPPYWKEITTDWEETCLQPSPDWVKLAEFKLETEPQIDKNLFALVKKQENNLTEVSISLELNESVIDPSNIFQAELSKSSPKNDLSSQITYEPDNFFDLVLSEPHTWEKYRGIAIIGDPGYGKTIYLQKIASLVLSKNKGIPIWINLNQIVDEDNNLISVEKYLYENWLPQALKKTPEVTPSNSEKENFKKQLETGNVWLFLDGLNEINASSPLRAINQELSDLLKTAKVKIIITCRSNLWLRRNNELNDFQCYRAKLYSDEQREEFINKFFADSKEKGRELIEQLNLTENDRLKSLMSQPLCLTLLCLSWRRNSIDFASLTQSELYRYFINEFKEWKPEIFSDSDKYLPDLEKKLCKLSKEALDDNSILFRLSESWLKNYLGESDDEKSYFWMAKKLGWLNQVEESFGEPYYSFIDISFQEYFAALDIQDWDFFLPKNHVNKLIEGEKYRIFNKRWRFVIGLWLGRKSIAPDLKLEFIDALFNFEDGCLKYNLYGYRAVLSICSVIKELKNIAPALIENINKKAEIYFQKCLDLELVFLTKRLIETIDREKINTQPVINFLKAATKSKTAWLKLLAIKTIVNLGVKDLTFVKPLLEDEDRSVAHIAKFVLSENFSDPLIQSFVKNFYLSPQNRDQSGHKLVEPNDATMVEIKEKGVGELISLILESNSDSIKEDVYKFLEEGLNSSSQKRHEFLKAVKNQADKLLEQEEQISDLIDICLQKMSYPEFYQGWNS